MRIAVTADFMARRGDFPDQARIPLGNPAQNEEGRARRMPLKQFQNPVRLRFDAGRKRGPRLRRQRPLDLRGMEILLYIHRQSVEERHDFHRRGHELRRKRRSRTAPLYSSAKKPRTTSSAILWIISKSTSAQAPFHYDLFYPVESLPVDR